MKVHIYAAGVFLFFYATAFALADDRKISAKRIADMDNPDSTPEYRITDIDLVIDVDPIHVGESWHYTLQTARSGYVFTAYYTKGQGLTNTKAEETKRHEAKLDARKA